MTKTASLDFHVFVFLTNNVHKMIVLSLHKRIQRVLLRCEPCFVTCAWGRSLRFAGVRGHWGHGGAQAGGLEESFLLLTRVEGLQ